MENGRTGSHGLQLTMTSERHIPIKPGYRLEADLLLSGSSSNIDGW